MLLVAAASEKLTDAGGSANVMGVATGGTIINPQRRAPDHPSVRDPNGPSINCTALQNGESHKISPGDVVVIPAGVGHWFSAGGWKHPIPGCASGCGQSASAK
jgi:hypothetical protein